MLLATLQKEQAVWATRAYIFPNASETEMRSAGDQRRSRKEAQHSHAIFAIAGLKIKPKVPLGRQHIWWLWLYSLFLKRTFCCLNAPGAATSSSSSSCLLAVCDRGFWSITATNWNRKIKHVLLSLIENKSYFHLPCFPNLQNVLLVRCLFHPISLNIMKPLVSSFFFVLFLALTFF